MWSKLKKPTCPWFPFWCCFFFSLYTNRFTLWFRLCCKKTHGPQTYAFVQRKSRWNCMLNHQTRMYPLSTVKYTQKRFNLCIWSWTWQCSGVNFNSLHESKYNSCRVSEPIHVILKISRHATSYNNHRNDAIARCSTWINLLVSRYCCVYYSGLVLHWSMYGMVYCDYAGILLFLPYH